MKNIRKNTTLSQRDIEEDQLDMAPIRHRGRLCRRQPPRSRQKTDPERG